MIHCFFQQQIICKQVMQSSVRDRRGRKRMICKCCNKQILEEFFRTHETRCQFLSTFHHQSQRIVHQAIEKQKQEQNKEQKDLLIETEEQSKSENDKFKEDQNEEKLKILYHQLQVNKQNGQYRNTKQSRNIQAQSQVIELQEYQCKQSCKYCGKLVKYREIHQSICDEQYEDCQFCGEQTEKVKLTDHHRNCLQRERIKRYQYLMKDSSQEQEQSSDRSEIEPPIDDYDNSQSSFSTQEEEEKFHNFMDESNIINPNPDDVYQSNPYLRNCPYTSRSANKIYTHRPPISGTPYHSMRIPNTNGRILYRYKRQCLPPRQSLEDRQAQANLNLQHRVAQSLDRFGYGRDNIDRLREHPNFHYFLRTIDTFIQQDEQSTFQKSMQGMSEYEIHRLATRIFERQGMEKQEMCAICYNELQEGDELIDLICKHYFHEQCIRKWLQISFKCPICKASQVSRKVSLQN